MVEAAGADAGDLDWVRVVFDLPADSDGWPPARSERLWAVRVSEDSARLDNVPFFLCGFAVGDVVRTVVDKVGVVWAQDVIERSWNCTIRVIPAERRHEASARQAVLDAFAPLGVDGEVFAQYGMVALNVPADADLSVVKRLLIEGAQTGRWDYDEGCITPEWRAL